MRTLAAPLSAFLASYSSWWACRLFTIATPASGTLRWTDAPASITYGGNTYTAGPIVTASRAKCSARLEVDQVEIAVNPGTLTLGGYAFPRACALGLLDGSAVTVERLIGAYPYDGSKGTVLVFSGRVLEPVEPSSTEIRLLVSSAAGLMRDQSVPRRPVQIQCPYQVGDALCGATVLSDSRTTAGTSTTTSVQVSAAFTNASMNGVLTVGGVRRTIRWISGAVATLAEPLPVAPAAGLAVTATAGCDQTPQTCHTAFGNLARFGGSPEVPMETPSGYGESFVRPAPPRGSAPPPPPPPTPTEPPAPPYVDNGGGGAGGGSDGGGD